MELIKIYNGSLVDARELHTFLESKRQFANWIKDRIDRYGYKEGVDFFTSNKIVIRENSKRQGASKLKEYHLTIDTAKEIAMIENNQKGREARLYFIKAEETLQELRHDKRFEAFLKLETTKEKLRQNVLNIGGTDDDFLQIDLSGRKVLFNGHLIEDEELHTILLKGRDFATDLTNLEFHRKDIGLDEAEQLNQMNHQEVREMVERGAGKKPEELPREEKIKKLGE